MTLSLLWLKMAQKILLFVAVITLIMCETYVKRSVNVKHFISILEDNGVSQEIMRFSVNIYA